MLLSGLAFLFPLEYLADGNVGVCVSKSKLLTFLGNEFGELLTSFCSDINVSTVFHRTKVDIQSLLYIPSVLHSSCTIA